MSEKLPDLEQLLENDFWEVETVDQALRAIEEAEKFKNVYRFLMEKLREAINGEGAVSPDHAAAVLVDLENRIGLIDEAVMALRREGLGISQAREQAAREREEVIAGRKRRAQATLAKFGWAPGSKTPPPPDVAAVAEAAPPAPAAPEEMPPET